MAYILMKNPVLTLTAGMFTLWAGLASAELMKVVDISDGDTLNVRSGPGTSHADIGDINEHTYVNVTGYSNDRKWAQIQYRGQMAWVSAKHLSAGQSGGTGSTGLGTNVVTGIAANDADGGLVVRGGAGKSFARLGVLRNNTAVHVIQQDGDGKWAMIGFEGGVGWVSTAYLTAMNAAPTPMPSNPQVAPDGGPLPAVFTVTGVSVNDRLWVRDAPQVTGRRLGGLTPGAVVNVNGRALGNWVQITLNGQIGYINANYLTRASQSSGASTANGFPLGISCRGTEPHWTLSIAADRSVQYTSLIDGPDLISSLTQTTPSVGGGYPFNFTAQPYSGVLNSQACSDGMSDISYSMAIMLSRPSANGGTETLHGCCNVD